MGGWEGCAGGAAVGAADGGSDVCERGGSDVWGGSEGWGSEREGRGFCAGCGVGEVVGGGEGCGVGAAGGRKSSGAAAAAGGVEEGCASVRIEACAGDAADDGKKGCRSGVCGSEGCGVGGCS